MRIATNLLLLLSAIILLANISFAEAGTMSLADMIKYSDFIAVGKVVNARVHGKRIAELEVTQVLKGDRSLKRVRFYAAPSWACDISAAEQDEVGLFFLTNDLPPQLSKEKHSPYRDSEGVPVFFITHSGRGRMIFKHLDGDDYVYAYNGGEVKFPGSLRYARYPTPENRLLGLIRLGDVLSFIRKRV
jgi:hypothetical protein